MFALQDGMTYLVGRKRYRRSHRGLATQKAEKIVVCKTFDLSYPVVLTTTQNGYPVHNREHFL